MNVDDDRRARLDAIRRELRARERLARGEWGFAPVKACDGGVGA